MELSSVHPAVLSTPVTLRLPAKPVAVAYEAVAMWEAYANGDYQCSTITKQVRLQVRQESPGNYEVDFETSAPTLTKSQDLQSLEQMAVRLAALYERVMVRATSTGKFMALLNHDALLLTWAGIAQELRASTNAEDGVISTLLSFTDAQLQQPDRILQSLQHDYLYQTLLPNFYNQPLGSTELPARTRQFASFFDNAPLWFSEEVAVEPAQEPGQLTVVLHGTLDAQQTNTAAVQAAMVKALQLAPPPPDAPVLPTPLPAPHFAYEATYVLAQATGLPIRADLTVFARLGEVFNKQYSLTIIRQ